MEESRDIDCEFRLKGRACKDTGLLALALLPALLLDDEDSKLVDVEKVGEALATTLAVALVAVALFAEKFTAT